MTTLLWITDPHLNFLQPQQITEYGKGLCRKDKEPFDGIVISGDIAEAKNLPLLLPLFAASVAPKPIYFVLGNHDFYSGSFAEVRHATFQLQERIPTLHFLDTCGPIVLTDDTAICGHTGWYDGRLGDAQGSNVVLSDFTVIADLRKHYNPYDWDHEARTGSRNPLLSTLRKHADDSADIARHTLLAACEAREQVIFVTHFPPFANACWHEGKISDKNWLPWFTSAAMGRMLEDVALQHPKHSFLVLCGHTHSPGTYRHAENLLVKTGSADYGKRQTSGFVSSESFKGWPVLGAV